jgi:hypothetical protein
MTVIAKKTGTISFEFTASGDDVETQLFDAVVDNINESNPEKLDKIRSILSSYKED